MGIALISVPFTSLLYYFITPLLLVFWVIEGGWKEKWIRLKESPFFIIVCCLVLFWFINVMGLLYSNHIMRGLARTYDKLPFLVYPLVFFTLNKTYISQQKILTLFKGFVYATAIMLLISWGNAWVQYFITGDPHYFFYTQFTKFFGHPSYCALIVCIAFTLTFYPLASHLPPHTSHLPPLISHIAYLISHISPRISHISYRISHISPRISHISPRISHISPRISHIAYLISHLALLLFFATSIYFFQSRTGIIAFIFVLLFSLFYYLHIRKKSLGYGIVGILSLLILAVIVIKIFPNRIGNSIVKIDMTHLQADNILGLRSEIWSKTCRLAMENHLLGIGTGYHPESYVPEEDIEILARHHTFINAHNQFLQTFLEHGITGFGVLVFFILYSFYFAIKTRNYLLLMLMINIGINIFFESMFERAHGIFAFTLFYCLFVVKNNIFATDLKNTYE
jgi:O-antigen ligase